MKKLIFGLVACFLVIGSLDAQDAKTYKKAANKAFNAYKLDKTKKDKMQEAIDNVKKLIALDLANEQIADAHLLSAEIYNEIANEINNSKTLGVNTAEGLPEVKYPELQAYKGYKKALDNAVKKYHTKDAIKGIRNVQNYLSYRGIEYFQAKDFTGAYTTFNAMLDTDKILKDNQAESALSDEANYNNQLYLTGLAAYSSNLIDIAKGHFEALYQAGTDEGAVYEYLYKIYNDNEKQPEKAYKYLEEGRKKFPEELGLLFAEINHFLKLGKSEELIDKLKLAIKAEPKNVSLYNVLGNTYDNLSQNYEKEGDSDKSTEYFKLAVDQFSQAFDIDSKNTVAVYSIGQLYYNRAALKTQELQKYASDYSSEGMKKYDAAKKAVFEQFDKALPFFQKSESLDPNDKNTLIALKEIYAKKDDVETSNIFKDRLAKLEAPNAEKIKKSYFKSSDIDIKSIIDNIKK